MMLRRNDVEAKSALCGGCKQATDAAAAAAAFRELI